MKILHLEDNEAVADMMKRVLESECHTVVHDPSGAVGLGILKSGSFDMVICDYDFGRMRMNGEEVVKEIRKFSNVPVIANSSNPDHCKIMVKSGATVSLSKPCPIKDIIETVNSIAGGE